MAFTTNKRDPFIVRIEIRNETLVLFFILVFILIVLFFYFWFYTNFFCFVL